MKKELLGIILTLLVIYHVNGRPHPESDCVPAPYAAWSLIRHGSLDLSWCTTLQPYRGVCLRETPAGAWVSRYPPGSTVAMLPLIAPLALVREEPPPDGLMSALGKLAGALSVAAAASLFFLVCRELAPSARWPATVLFSLGTCLCSVASQAIWMHGPATFWLCAALFLLMRPGGLTVATSWAVGLALGLAVVTRPTTALVALATGTALLAQRQWRQAVHMACAGAIPVAILCLVNWRQFGSPVLGGYAGEYGNVPPPWWLGLAGLLIAPSRGVLVYSPALLLAPLGIVTLWQRRMHCGSQRRGLLLAWLLAAGLTILWYARWHDWKGGWCYGPRFLCEMMPILCLMFALAYSRLQAKRQRAAALGLLALSVAVHFVGIFGYSGYEAWQRRHDLPDQGRCLFELQDTQIEAHVRALLGKWWGQPGDGR
jgi:hypothetical protein